MMEERFKNFDLFAVVSSTSKIAFCLCQGESSRVKPTGVFAMNVKSVDHKYLIFINTNGYVPPIVILPPFE